MMGVAPCLGVDHLTFEGGGGGGGGWEIQTVQDFFVHSGEQDRYFFTVKVQRKIFSPIYFTAGYFFASHNNLSLQ
jgi:hypothetical protein